MVKSEIFEKELVIDESMSKKKIKEELLNKFSEYQKSLRYMASDAPIAILCLPKNIESALTKSGLLRIYDLFNSDLAKVKGLNDVLVRDLTSRLDQFIAMF